MEFWLSTVRLHIALLKQVHSTCRHCFQTMKRKLKLQLAPGGSSSGPARPALKMRGSVAAPPRPLLKLVLKKPAGLSEELRRWGEDSDPWEEVERSPAAAASMAGSAHSWQRLQCFKERCPGQSCTKRRTEDKECSPFCCKCCMLWTTDPQ